MGTYHNDLNYQSFEKLLKVFLNSHSEIGQVRKFYTGWIAINLYIHLQQIKEYRFIKVTYRSVANWKSTTDYLRCSPSFFHRPRRDFALCESSSGFYFAKLLFVFTLQLKQDIVLPLALILPYDRIITSAKQTRDRNLGLYRVRHQSRPQIIHMDSIICGAVVFPSFEDDHEGFVFDVLDTDMFWRVKDLIATAQ